MQMLDLNELQSEFHINSDVDFLAREPPIVRVSFASTFPPIVVMRPYPTWRRMVEHPAYDQAKAGDFRAAVLVVRNLLTAPAMRRLRDLIADRSPIVAPVYASPLRNALPLAFGVIISERLHLELDTQLVQLSTAQRTAANGLFRLKNRVAFSGEVTGDRDYLIVDDMVTQGGTLADFRSYIEQHGGRVVGATALGSADGSQVLAPRPETVAELRRKFPGLEAWWRRRYGWGFEALTESEARYIARLRSARSLQG